MYNVTIVPRATSFSLKPYTYKRSDGQYGGWEYRVMEAIAQNLNFRCSFVEEKVGEIKLIVMLLVVQFGR